MLSSHTVAFTMQLWNIGCNALFQQKNIDFLLNDGALKFSQNQSTAQEFQLEKAHKFALVLEDCTANNTTTHCLF